MGPNLRRSVTVSAKQSKAKRNWANAGDMYEIKPPGVEPITVFTVFLFLYELNVARWLTGFEGFCIRISVPSTMTQVDGNLR